MVKASDCDLGDRGSVPHSVTKLAGREIGAQSLPPQCYLSHREKDGMEINKLKRVMAAKVEGFLLPPPPPSKRGAWYGQSGREDFPPSFSSKNKTGFRWVQSQLVTHLASGDIRCRAGKAQLPGNHLATQASPLLPSRLSAGSRMST